MKITERDLDEHFRTIGKAKLDLTEETLREEIKSRAVNWTLTPLATEPEAAGGEPFHRNPQIVSEHFALGLTAGKH